jgi:diguanylate cyclase (GGDEF)-like protein
MTGPRILLARHQSGSADHLAAGLPGEGFTVEETRNMAATWISVRNRPPEAVLLAPLSHDTASAEFQSLLELCLAPGGPALLVLTEDPEFLVERIDAVDDFLSPDMGVGITARRLRFMLARRRALTRLRGEHQVLLKRSITDYKTGLYNDRHFAERGAEELSRARRQELPLGVLMIDFDGFKAINDVHGHPFGDHVLATFATALRSRLRDFDVAARMGGDEFAVLLPSTRLEDAIGIAERVRAAVSGLDVSHAGRRTALSVSIGVSTWLPQDNLPLDLVLAGADAALLLAKQTGRSRIGVHDGDGNRVLGATTVVVAASAAAMPAVPMPSAQVKSGAVTPASHRSPG